MPFTQLNEIFTSLTINYHKVKTPRVGFEPTTSRLTAERTSSCAFRAIFSHYINNYNKYLKKSIFIRNQFLL